ncbi:MAG: Mobile element protein [uncultured Arthrobacter sp.]|uniref:Mobile element protein n=1 Tax=uncultured Arthrobacter sp. TaxID=114050 RepID=A0A6J4J7U8_9MICC|nr:IS481 family transposase [uncultured Arthrobacter sp.]CAA9271862.1 MAG: Mobile element protein [uncultured Arthrobacter sp.]
MSHANARLTVHGRFLLIERVIGDRRPVAHVARELGISRQCAHRWVNRYRAGAGLLDRSSRPHRSPARTSPEREDAVLAARKELRCGPDRLSQVTGVPARTICRILTRHRVPPLAACDPLTGAPIRASRASAVRYERARPGELIHVDVKKLGRIPEGGGWRADPDQSRVNHRSGRRKLGFDYIHAAIDDHTRIAYAEIHPDEKGTTAAGFLTRAGAFFNACGIERIERILTDNAFAYRNSAAFQQAAADLGAVQRFIKPHCPWTNGKAERFNRTLATEWAYARTYTSNTDRTHALDPWLRHYNTERIHTGIGTTPINRVTPT